MVCVFLLSVNFKHSNTRFSSFFKVENINVNSVGFTLGGIKILIEAKNFEG